MAARDRRTGANQTEAADPRESVSLAPLARSLNLIDELFLGCRLVTERPGDAPDVLRDPLDLGVVRIELGLLLLKLDDLLRVAKDRLLGCS